MWLLSIFLLLMGTIIGLLLNDRINKPLGKMSVYETSKIICLITPTIISMIILVSLFFADKVSIEAGGLGIFGILATVWLGLNIYNFIEKRELENLNKEFIDIKNKTIDNIKIQENLIEELKIQKEEHKHEIDKLHSQLLESEKNNYIQSTTALALAINDEEQEITYYNDIVNKYPDDVIGYFLRVKYYKDKNDYDKVIDNLNELIRINPNDYTSYNSRGNAKKAKGDIEGAISDYDEAIKLDSEYTYAYFCRGNAKQGKKDIEGAISDYNRVIEVDSKDAYAYCFRGNAKEAKGDIEGAISDYDKTIEVNSNYAYAYCCRGNVKKEKGDIEGAISDYDEAIKLDSEYAYAYFCRGIAKKEQGDIAENSIDNNLNKEEVVELYDKAIASFEKYLEFDKEDKDVIELIDEIKMKIEEIKK